MYVGRQQRRASKQLVSTVLVHHADLPGVYQRLIGYGRHDA